VLRPANGRVRDFLIYRPHWANRVELSDRGLVGAVAGRPHTSTLADPFPNSRSAGGGGSGAAIPSTGPVISFAREGEFLAAPSEGFPAPRPRFFSDVVDLTAFRLVVFPVISRDSPKGRKYRAAGRHRPDCATVATRSRLARSSRLVRRIGR
jgi:hypothetical protein